MSRHALKHFSARHTRRRFKLAFYVPTKKKYIFYIIVSVKEVIKLYKGQQCLAAFCGVKV